MKYRGNVVIAVLLGVIVASLIGLTGDQILQNVYDSTNTALRTNLVAGGGSATPVPASTATPLAFGTPGVIAIFGSPELQPYAGFTPSAGYVTGLSASGAPTLATPVPTPSFGITFPQTVGGTVTSGGIPYFNSTTQMSSSALLGAGQVVLGGGAGSAPNSSSAFTFSGGTATINSGANAVSPLVVQDNGVAAFSVLHNASTVVNGVTVLGGAAGVDPMIASGSNTALRLSGAGSTGVSFSSGGGSGWIGRFSTVSSAATLENPSNSSIGFTSSTNEGAALDAFWTRSAAATIQQGASVSGNATGQVYKGPNSIGANGNGGSLDLEGGAANGSGVDANVLIATTRGGVKLGGGVYYPGIVSVSSNGNVALTTVTENCTSGASAITRTLPAATGSGRTVHLSKADNGAGTCIFGRTGSDALNGGTTRTLSNQYQVDTCYDMGSAQWICQGDGT